MNPLERKAPALEQIYNQRYQYHVHQQKLSKIYETRKSHLGFDNQRVNYFRNIKQAKVKSFVHKFNRHNEDIAKNNLKLLAKIENVKASVTSTKYEDGNHCFITPLMKKRIAQREKQNLRISTKMRNMSSGLNQKNFIKDYAKSQQIKNRIMKYTTEESKVYLKSQKYFSENEENSSVLSRKSKARASQESEAEYSSQHNKMSKHTTIRRSLASHYRKQDILKNRIDSKSSSLVNIKKMNKYRPNTSIEQNSTKEQINFFPTQIKKHRVIKLKH